MESRGERDGLTRQHPLPARKLRQSLNDKIAAMGQEIYLCSTDPWLGIDPTLSADILVPMRKFHYVTERKPIYSYIRCHCIYVIGGNYF